MATPNPTAILLVSCPDQRGIVAALSTFITQHNGNIIALDQYVDTEERVFFARMEWELDGFAFPSNSSPRSSTPSPGPAASPGPCTAPTSPCAWP
jgi:formyltetrahydrofolate hydrolase